MRLALCYQHVDPKRGGAETYVADLCRRLAARGCSVTLFAESCARDQIGPGTQWRSVPPRGRTSLGRIWHFAEACESLLAADRAQFDCTIGFINTWGQDVLIPQGGVRAASLRANAARFRSAAASTGYRLLKQINFKWWVYQAIESRQYDPARRTRVVAVSQMVKAHLERDWRVPAERIDVIPNAIDAARLAVSNPGTTRAEYRAAVGLGANDLVALFTGHNFRLKGLGPLLDALAARGSGARPVHLLVCGGGRAAPFRQQARRLGIERFVHFAGYADDVRPCFHASDFFVLPTYYDPCSLVVFEALACGLPVITTRRNGAGELIREGVEGFVIGAPDDTASLTGAIDRLADDDFRAAAACDARTLGNEQSFDRHVDRLLAVCERVAEERRRRDTLPAAAHQARHASRPVGV